MTEKLNREEEKRRQKEEWQRANRQSKEHKDHKGLGLIHKKTDAEQHKASTTEAVRQEPTGLASHPTSPPSEAPPRPTPITTRPTTPPNTTAPPADKALSPKSPESPKSGSDRRVKSWIAKRFSHKPSHHKTHDSSRKSSSSSDSADAEHKKGFVGGAALTGASHPDSSMRDVALAGRRSSEAEVESERVSRFDRDGAGVPADVEGRSLRSIPTELDVPLDPVGGVHAHAHVQPHEGAGKQGTTEQYEEARDTFESEKLAPPVPVGRSSESPARDSKFREVL